MAEAARPMATVATAMEVVASRRVTGWVAAEVIMAAASEATRTGQTLATASVASYRHLGFDGQLVREYRKGGRAHGDES